ncbi:PaaI family thioesterase [Frankia sp. AgKG'84/4]|uniref:PaaI family thioesterase n=1 Tax=Frankia sp. AgKG'84/4 TaxID=573490 RepID=UPI0020102EE2|nr:PaaI family thioesterase [Frankia sp. AgKG'84/4]MCL9793518.1 PaaI family thioesterase [Frankia sp. AgKG'84/4]
MTNTSPILELGLSGELGEEAAFGRAEVVPEMCGPGGSALRTSILATWADLLTGSLAVVLMGPRIPITLDLQVEVVEPAEPGDEISLEGTVLKRGRSVLVCETRVRRAGGSLLAVVHTTFMLSPDPRHVFPDGYLPGIPESKGRLPVPFAERVGCVVGVPGTAEVAHQSGGTNAAGAIQGGLVALVAEEAAFSLFDEPRFHQAMVIRYLRPFTVGPARAVAERHGETCLVRLTDEGARKLGAVATLRPI